MGKDFGGSEGVKVPGKFRKYFGRKVLVPLP